MNGRRNGIETHLDKHHDSMLPRLFPVLNHPTAKSRGALESPQIVCMDNRSESVASVSTLAPPPSSCDGGSVGASLSDNVCLAWCCSATLLCLSMVSAALREMTQAYNCWLSLRLRLILKNRLFNIKIWGLRIWNLRIWDLICWGCSFLRFPRLGQMGRISSWSNL